MAFGNLNFIIIIIVIIFNVDGHILFILDFDLILLFLN